MKKLALLLLITCHWMVGCDKDDENKNLTLNVGELKQTVWKGTLLYTSSGKIDQIGVFFISEDRGSYEVISDFEGETREESNVFAYQIDGKGLYINPASGYFLSGTWLLTKKTKKKLIFHLYPESNSTFVITLNKVE